MEYKCKECGVIFKAFPREKRKFCSKKCFLTWKKQNLTGKNHPNYSERTIVKCEICGKEIEVIPSRVGRTKVCSLECRYEKQRRKKPCEHPQWKGGERIHQGYSYIHSPKHPHKNKDNYYPKHRLVMEKHLGRILDPDEVVHHKNGDVTDNRLENLKLYKNNKEHLRDTLWKK